MEFRNTNIAVIGGGAAGLAAAVECSRLFGKGSTLIIEKQQRTGRKLLATGNGRCNITNSGIDESRYHGDMEIIHSVLSGHSYEDMCVFMRSLGVLLREESEGRVYPYSNQASTVLDALRNECSRLGADELCGYDIKQIKKEKGGFLLISDDMNIFAKNVIFATGSQASQSLGSDESGYKLLDGLGIRHTPLFPALSPVSTKEKYKELKGVRAKGRVSLFADGNIIQSTEGEIQFTDNGISGICVFELSRAVNEFFALGTVCGRHYKSISISADIMNDFSFTELCDYLYMCRGIFSDKGAEMLLSGAVNKKLAHTAAVICGLADKKCGSLNGRDIKRLADCIKNMKFTPVQSDTFRTAQVSAGGINSGYVDPLTLCSRKYKGLYICGELLDADGDCGGFNLHFAVGSALKAAHQMWNLESGINDILLTAKH